jgi:glycosyltransferase involved in cell wall biosynthesis
LAEPSVTAAIVVHDGEAYLGEAIESALAQTRPCGQLIVVDNGSTDRSAEIAASYPEVEVVSEPARGIGRARNAALRAFRGDYLAFLDADDRWAPNKTELQLAAFAADESLDLAFGQMLQFLSPDLDPAAAAELSVPADPQPGLHIGAMLASRATIEAVGPWPEEIAVSDGLSFLLSAGELGLRQAMLPEIVTYRRVHSANHSFRNRDERAEFARYLKRSLDRRREHGAGRSGV